jgi:hypothetical protein
MHRTIQPWEIFLLCHFLAICGCTPKVKSNSHESDGTVSTSQISAAQGGQVGIKNGSNVAIPAGALPFDGQVTVEKVPTPAELSAVGVDSASDAIAISAVGSDGAAIEQSLQPMKISITLSQDSTLNLTTAGRAEDLCALVTTKGQKLFVWRATSLEISDGKASFKSKLFGTYKLSYCGQKPLSGFSNPTIAGFTEGAKIEAKIQIPTGFEQGLGPHGQYCLALVQKGLLKCETSSSCQIGTEALLSTVAPSTEASLTVSLSFVPSGLNPQAKPYLQLYLLDSATGCPFRNGDFVDSLPETPAMRSLYDFAMSKNDLEQGVRGTLGEEGPFKLGLLSFFIGGSGEADNFPTIDKSSVCVTWEIAEKASAKHGAKISDGKWQGVPEWEMPIALGAQGTDQPASVRIDIGAPCNYPSSSRDSVFSTLEPYSLTTKVVGSIYLTPVTLGFVISDSRYVDQKACVEVRDNANSERFATLPLTLKSQDLLVYLPHPKSSSGGQPAYDFKIMMVGDQKNCEGPLESLPAVERKGVLLKSKIELAL